MIPTPTAVAAPPKRMTVDEFWEFVNLPENSARLFELRRGEVIELSLPKSPHGIVMTNFATELTLYARRVRKGFVTSGDAGVVLAERPGTVVGPDAAYFTNASRFADVAPKWAVVPPVVAVEVLSPSDWYGEVTEKVTDYLQSGVKLVWVADPERKTITVHGPGGSHALLREADTLVGGEVLPGFSCRVGDFFLAAGEYEEATAPPPAA